MARKSSGARGGGAVAENRRARRDYEIVQTLEAGLVLHGTEVKSLRLGRADLAHAFAAIRGGEGFLMNADIPEYHGGGQFNHERARPRKLLLHRREIDRLMAAVKRDGMTLVPLKLYFDARGHVKLLLGLGRGRKKIDKREVEKKRDWERRKTRLLRTR